MSATDNQHEIVVHEVTRKHVRLNVFPPGGPTAVAGAGYMFPALALKLRKGVWRGKFDITNAKVGPFTSVEQAVAALTEAVNA